jgi:hypothetical protein
MLPSSILKLLPFTLGFNFSSVIALSLFFSLLIAVYAVSIFLIQCWTLRKFNGPFALPLIGNCYQAEALYFLKYLGKLKKRYGNIYTFFSFTKPYIVVAEPAVVRRVLSDTKTFVKGIDYTSQFAVLFGEGLVTSNGERHKADRSCFGKYFIRSNISKYMKMANERVVELMESSVTPGKPQNIEEFFAILSLRVFMSFSTSTDYRDNPEKEKEICHLVANASWATGRMITLGLPVWDIFPPTKIIKNCRRGLCKVKNRIHSTS